MNGFAPWTIRSFTLMATKSIQIVSNLLYVLLNTVGPDFNFLLITIAGENYSGGLGSAAFVAYLSVLCKKEFSGTQYALLSSVMGIARTFLSSPSGFIVESLGWSYFFVLSTILDLSADIISLFKSKIKPSSKLNTFSISSSTIVSFAL